MNTLDKNNTEGEKSKILNNIEKNKSFNTSIEKLIGEITYDYSENDRRGQHRGIINGKIVIRQLSEIDFKNNVKEIKDSIKESYNNGNIIGLLKSKEGATFGISSNFKTYLHILINKNFFKKEGDMEISSTCLENIFSKGLNTRHSYVLSEGQVDRISQLEFNEPILDILSLENIKFSQDGYFEDIKNCYKAIFKSALKHNDFDSIINLKPIEIGDKNGTICVMEGSHKILALNEVIDELKEANKIEELDEMGMRSFVSLLEKLNIKRVDFNIGEFGSEELEKLDINEIDSVDEPIVRHYLFNVVDNGLNFQND